MNTVHQSEQTLINKEEPSEITYQAMEDAEKGREFHGPFNSVEDFMKHLNT